MKKFCLSLLTLLSCTWQISSYAAATYPTYVCPQSFRPVSQGNTMAMVQAACGNPSSITNKQQQIVTPVTTTQWTYTLGTISVQGVPIYLPGITVKFQNNVIVEIDKNGATGLLTSGYCAVNGNINVGDPMNKVLLTCGPPNFTSTQETQMVSSKPITEWVYNNGPYKPQIIFDFDNGILTQITTGALGQ